MTGGSEGSCWSECLRRQSWARWAGRRLREGSTFSGPQDINSLSVIAANLSPSVWCLFLKDILNFHLLA